MIKFAVPENDQSVYEITTLSGKKYFVRCPGMCSPEDETKDGIFAFLVENNGERPVILRHLQNIVSFTRRPDLPIGEPKPKSMYDLLWHRLGEGCYSFLHYELD